MDRIRHMFAVFVLAVLVALPSFAVSQESVLRADRTVIYGSHSRQQIDVFEPQGAVDPLPLVLFVHGGAWTAGDHRRVHAKPAHFTRQDYYFASTGYRLLPETPVEQQAEDIGAAIRALRGQAEAIGFDPDRIVIIGHSAGAHLAALVASDPQYAGDSFDAIKGVILLDSGGYDIPATLATTTGRSAQLYSYVFGDDPARQMALSPLAQVGGEDAPNWLALYVSERDRTKAQSESLVAQLSANGATADAMAIANTNHGRLNREIGLDAGAQQTQAIDAFLARVFD